MGEDACRCLLLEKLNQSGLVPTDDVAKPTWHRRVTFDLTGLPPTIEEIDAFVADSSGDAYDRVIERLLASPHYGERWGRHWLDVARYADSNGLDETSPLATRGGIAIMWFVRSTTINRLTICD